MQEFSAGTQTDLHRKPGFTKRVSSATVLRISQKVAASWGKVILK